MGSFSEYTAAMVRLRRLTGIGYAVAMDSARAGNASLQIVTFLPNGTSHVSHVAGPMPFSMVADVVTRAEAAAAAAAAEAGGGRREVCAAAVAAIG